MGGGCGHCHLGENHRHLGAQVRGDMVHVDGLQAGSFSGEGGGARSEPRSHSSPNEEGKAAAAAARPRPAQGLAPNLLVAREHDT